MKEILIQFSVSVEIKKSLDEHCLKTGRKKAPLMRAILREYLKTNGVK